jgi:hypothetical protein
MAPYSENAWTYDVKEGNIIYHTRNSKAQDTQHN